MTLSRRGLLATAAPAAAITACTLGIFVGDLGLWALGAVGDNWIARVGWLERLAVRARAHPAVRGVRQNVSAAIVASRFLPGTRLPVYVAAGLAGVPFRAFAAWSFLACAIWTPALILGAGRLGRLAELFTVPAGVPPFALHAFGALTFLPLVAFVRTGVTPSVRQRVSARLARWRRWEFWPMWLFYAPVALWILWLTIRHRPIAWCPTAVPQSGRLLRVDSGRVVLLD